MAVTFNIQFRISVATKVIRLTDTSSGFTFNKGCFKVEFPNGVVRNLPDFSAPDLVAAAIYIDVPCELDVSGNVITGSYTVSYAVIDNVGNGQTPLVRTFDFNWVEPTNGITDFSDVTIPEVVFKDLTSYSPIGSFTGTLYSNGNTRTISSAFPSTSEVSANAPITSTSTNTISVFTAGNYYEGVYTPTSAVSITYTHSSNAWLTIFYSRTFSKTFSIKKCPSQLELVQKINAYRAIIDTYKETNDTQFNILSEQYDLVIALYSHLIARYNTNTQDGSEYILRELLSILEPYTATYTYQATEIFPFELASSTSNSFTISDGTNTDVVALGSTLTFASSNVALLPIVTNNNITYSPTFGTTINTFAQGNDSRFHNPVTIGTANGLSISTQAISLAAATTGSAGAMSAADKTKLDGVATGATANVGTVTSVSLTAPAAFTVTGSPITTSGTLAIAASGTSLQYITGAGALATLNTSNVPEDTNLYYTNARSRAAINLTTSGTSGAATYNNSTGILNIPNYVGGVTSFNTRTGAIVLSSTDVTTALSFTPYNATNPSAYISLTSLSFVAGSGAYNNTTGVITIPTNNNQLTNGAGYLTSSTATTTYVPYTGASGNVNLGTNNISANNFLNAFSNINASATQVVLTVASAPEIVVNGSGGQTIKLPDATTLSNGASFFFNNNQSSGAITVNNNSNTLIVSVPSGGYTEVILIDNSTAAGSWDRHFEAPANVSWSTNTFDYAGSITSATWNGNVVQPNRGGTGQSTYTDGQLLIGNTSGNTLSKATLSAGTGITITNGNGSISIANAGIIGSGTTNTIPKFTSTSAIGNSNITDSGTTISLNSYTNINGFIGGSTTQVLPAGNTFIGQTFNITGSANWGIVSRNQWNINDDAFTFSAFTPLDNRVTVNRSVTSSGYNIYQAYLLNNGTASQFGTGFTSFSAGTGNFSLFTAYKVGASGPPNNTNTYTNYYCLEISQTPNNNVINFYGLSIADTTATTITRALNLQLSSGTGKYNIYAGGTAANYLNGSLLIGSTTDAGFKLDVTGLERSRGTTASDNPTLGSELAAVAGTGTSWALAGTDLSVGGYTHTTGDVTPLTTTLSASIGTYYAIVYTITGRTTGSITIDYGGISLGGITASSGTGLPALSTAVLTITPTTDFNGTVVLSIKTIGTSSASSTFSTSSGGSNVEIRANASSGTFIGLNAGRRNVAVIANVGIQNTFIGNNAGANNTSGRFNTFIGFTAGQLNSIGSNNTVVGASAGVAITFGGSNTMMGHNAGQVTSTGGSNTFIGQASGRTNTTGGANTFLGTAAGRDNISGNNNSFVGLEAGAINTTGSNNSFFGMNAGLLNSTGGNSVVIGYDAMRNHTTGSGNVVIGYNAGRGYSGSEVSYIANNTILIGQGARALGDNQTNQIVIGNGAIGLGSNTTIIGNSSTTLTALYGAVIAGGTATDASAQLQIDSTTKGVLFPRMTTTQKNAIGTPAAGLVIYDTSLGKLCVRTTSAWETITSL
jgi:hypothetical protein